MNDERTIREMIDACRPGHADLQSDEFQVLANKLLEDEQTKVAFERSQELDAAIVAAMRDVPIPQGLENRLLESLAIAADDEQCLADASTEECPTEQIPSGPTVARRSRYSWPNRRFVLAAASAAAIAFLPFFIWGPRPDHAVTEQQLTEMALSWPHQLNASNWSNSTQDLPVTPLPIHQIAFVPRRWQHFNGISNSPSGLCFDVDVLLTRKALLFVLPAAGTSVTATAPPAAPFTTQGKCVSVWAGAKFVFVLVFDGSQEDYRRLILRGPLA